MKTTNVIMASLAVLLIAGCSQNEVMEVSPDANPQVGFNVYTGVSTKGVDMTTESMKDDPEDPNKYGGFGIMGYFTGQDKFEDVKTEVTPSFMHNQMVKWDATKNAWTYTPIKYWPNRPGEKISFFAYAPYEDDWEHGTKAGVTVSTANAKGIPYIDFKLKTSDDVEKMVDLVVDDLRDMEYTAQNKGEISFGFEHTLSRISFRAYLGDGNFTGMDGTNSFVYITRMWIVGTDHTAANSNQSLIPNTSTVNANSKFYTSARWSELCWKYNIPNATATIAAADFSLDKMLNVDGGITESNPAPGHTSGGLTKGVKLTSATQGADGTNAIPLFKDKQYLYLIPVGEVSGTDLAQNKGCAEGDIKIGFHYDIATKDATNPSQYIVSHAEAFIDLPAGHMKRKESYVYTLKINLHEIKISDAEVKDWSAVDEEVEIQ